MASDSLLKAFVIRVNAPTKSRNGWVDMGYAGFPGCLTSFSSAGTYVAIHDVQVRSGPKARALTPRVVALMELMETIQPGSDAAAEAAKQLGSHSFALGGNAMFAWDASTKAAGACVLEFGPVSGDAPPAVARSVGPDGFIACSNHFRLRTKPSRCRRFNSIVKSLSAGKPVDLSGAWKTIQSASVRGTLYRLVANLQTGDVELDRKLKQGSTLFEKRAKFNYRALLKEAARPAIGVGSK
jgi:hypothetical protein